MKRGPQLNENKALFISSLLRNTKEVFDSIISHKASRKIHLSDCLMSGLAMFSLKSPSLLAFDNRSDDTIVRHN